MIVEIVSIVLSVLLSAISIFIAIKAYKQGNKQIEISNKQSLFKQRIEKIYLINRLYSLYGSHIKHLKEENYIYHPDLFLIFLFNDKELFDVGSIVENPLSANSKNKFLLKYENLKQIAFEIPLLWDCPEISKFVLFVENYAEFLLFLYKQLRMVELLKAKEKSDKYNKKVLQAMARDLGAEDISNRLSEIYEEINKTKLLEKLKEQIKLK